MRRLVAAFSFFLMAFYTALGSAASPPPNILFVIMDDVGIDQMSAFGYKIDGVSPPTPNINTIATSGVRFSNHWSMTACSPSRASIFNGRFPIRSNVMGALGNSDLANSMAGPYDITVPKLLKNKNYQSALFGKFHMALQGHDPYQLEMVQSLGFDYFEGWIDPTGDPQTIDTTAGGVGGTSGNGNVYGCGFVPGSNVVGGADIGACYAADGSCKSISSDKNSPNPAGRQCRDQGGIFNPNAACLATAPSNIQNAFLNNYNGHYVSPVGVLENGKTRSLPITDPRSRTYRGTLPVDAALNWIKKQPTTQPWMATISFATDHTPLMQPPVSQLPPDDVVNTNGFSCSSKATGEVHVLSNQMISAMDHEFGRLMVGLGLATKDASGALVYRPDQSNTMVVIVGDNGSFGGTVKLPFDPTRAKGTSYQTGVWVPLIVAGPQVVNPNRAVYAMTNHVDMYSLFGEMAGLDVEKLVPWQIDARPMLPYLKNANQRPIRNWNFNQNGPNDQANGGVNGPCVTSGSCTQIPPNQQVCQDNGGEWWGESSGKTMEDGKPYSYCCQVSKTLAASGEKLPSILPLRSVGIRNYRYKLVENSTKEYSASVQSGCIDTTSYELYRIDEKTPHPRIDLEGLALLNAKKTTTKGTLDLSGLSPLEKANFKSLSYKLARLQKSVVDCPGDGNLDNVVNQLDVIEWVKYSHMVNTVVEDDANSSSWYDFNLDGETDSKDLMFIINNYGKHCKAPPPPR